MHQSCFYIQGIPLQSHLYVSQSTYHCVSTCSITTVRVQNAVHQPSTPSSIGNQLVSVRSKSFHFLYFLEFATRLLCWLTISQLMALFVSQVKYQVTDISTHYIAIIHQFITLLTFSQSSEYNF